MPFSNSLATKLNIGLSSSVSKVQSMPDPSGHCTQSKMCGEVRIPGQGIHNHRAWWPIRLSFVLTPSCEIYSEWASRCRDIVAFVVFCRKASTALRASQPCLVTMAVETSKKQAVPRDQVLKHNMGTESQAKSQQHGSCDEVTVHTARRMQFSPVRRLLDCNKIVRMRMPI